MSNIPVSQWWTFHIELLARGSPDLANEQYSTNQTIFTRKIDSRHNALMGAVGCLHLSEDSSGLDCRE